MGKTPTSKFSGQQFKSGALLDWVVKITIGATDYHFSQRPMRFGAVQTIDVLKQHSGIKNKVDVIANTWAVGGTTITLRNVPYKKDTSGNWVRISDLFADVDKSTVEIYAVAGNADALDETTDAVLKFTGTVSEAASFDTNTVMIRVQSISEDFNKGLPKSYAPVVLVNYTIDPVTGARSSTYRRINQPTGAQMVPINYGTWSASDHGNVGVGLAYGIPLSGSAQTEICVAAHAMKDVDDVWFTQEGVDATYTDGQQKFKSFEHMTFTLTENDYHIVGPSETAYLRVYPSKRLPTTDDIKPTKNPSGIWSDDYIPGGETYMIATSENNGKFAWGLINPFTADQVLAINDKDNTTYAELWNSNNFREFSDDFDTDHRGEEANDRYVYNLQAWNGVTFPTIGNVDEIGDQVAGAIEVYWTEEPNINIEFFQVRLLHRKAASATDMAVQFSNNLVPDQWNEIPFSVTNAGGGISLSIIDDYGWDFTFNKSNPMNATTRLEPHFPLALVFRATCPDGTGWQGPDRNTHSLARVNNANLKFEYKPLAVSDYYVAGSGSAASSWIQAAGRTNSLSTGDLLQDPAFIIEDILRTHVAVPVGNIDTASFDAAENTSMSTRLNIHADNKNSVNSFIKQISEQSTFAFCYTSSGQARLIPMNDTTPTTTRIIPFSHIKDGKIKIKKRRAYCNNLNVQHRYLPEEGGAFKSISNYTNSTSQSSFGEEIQDAAFENITNNKQATTDSVDHIGAHLVGNSNAIWANEHLIIELELVGFTGNDLEVGDYIELDATTCDPQLKPYGSSWSGKQFLIIEPTHKMLGTKIKAMEIYA